MLLERGGYGGGGTVVGTEVILVECGHQTGERLFASGLSVVAPPRRRSIHPAAGVSKLLIFAEPASCRLNIQILFRYSVQLCLYHLEVSVQI